MLPVGRRMYISAQPVHEHAHVCFERSTVCGETYWLLSRLPSILSGASGLLLRRESASNEPDELLKRPSFDGCRKNLPPCSFGCGYGVGATEDDVEQVKSVLSESRPLEYKKIE